MNKSNRKSDIDNFNLNEDKEILDIEKILLTKDFSKYGDKKNIFNKTFNKINEKEGVRVMKVSRFKRISIAAVFCMIVCVSLIHTSFANGIVSKVKQIITLSNIKIIQVEDNKNIKEMAIPSNLKGKLFDDSGRPINSFKREYKGKMYTAKGEEIVGFGNGNIITKKDEEIEEKENMLIVKDVSKLSEYTCFKVKLPSYMPKDFKFDRAEFYKEKNQTNVKDSKYIDLYFTNKKTGKFIYMQQRFSDKETAYETGTDGTVEKIMINGVQGVLADDKNIDWEKDNVLYTMSSRRNISKDELIKIAESIK